MTTINAIRIDSQSGLLICDEARTWADGRVRLLTAEKIRPLTDPEVVEATGSLIFYGKTGSSTLGNEYLETARARVTALFRERVRAEGLPLKHFLSVREVAELLWQTLCNVKHRHTDMHLRARWGFERDDFLVGRYRSVEGQEVEIADPTCTREVHDLLVGAATAAEAKPVFGNSQIVAGYDPSEGFAIWRSSLGAPHCEPVEEIFTCAGSGSDSADLSMTFFAESLSARQRRQGMDRAVAAAALLEAVDVANGHNAGCDGCPKIHWVNGGAKERRDMHRQIHDGRSMLAMEIVRAGLRDFLPRRRALDLLDGLLFEQVSFLATQEAFFEGATDLPGLRRFLRGARPRPLWDR